MNMSSAVEVTELVILSVGQVVLQARREGNRSHGCRVIQSPQTHVASDYQSAQVLQRPWLTWGHTSKHAVQLYVKGNSTML